MDSGIVFLLTCLGLGLGIIVYVIAADKKRFLTQFDLAQWRESYYLRSLPNFLQALNDNHFKTAWPVKCNAMSAAFFCFRTRPLLKRKPAKLRRLFLRQHIILFALRDCLQPYLRDFFLHQQQRIIGNRILAMEDTLDRDRLMNYLDEVRMVRDVFQHTLTPADRSIMVEMADRQVIATFRRAHAIFQEHGYSLLPEFSELRRWQELSGAELVQELPPLRRRSRRLLLET